MRGKLTYANVMATIAVFVALGGGAYALQHRSAGKAPKLHSYRIAKKLEGGKLNVTIWKHGVFRIKANCFVPPSDASTTAEARIGSPKSGWYYTTSIAGEGSAQPSVFVSDDPDPGEYDLLVHSASGNQFKSPAHATFGATYPATNERPQQTVTGNLVTLAGHHVPGKDCTVTGEVTAG